MSKSTAAAAAAAAEVAVVRTNQEIQSGAQDTARLYLYIHTDILRVLHRFGRGEFKRQQQRNKLKEDNRKQEKERDLKAAKSRDLVHERKDLRLECAS